MKFSTTLAAVIAASCFTVTTVFAAPGTSSSPGINAPQQKNDVTGMQGKHLKRKEFKEKREDFCKDPVKALQTRKEKVQTMLKEGKITKEKADAITARMDAKIKEIQEFNKLTLKQKREKLINNFKASVEKKVQKGELTRNEADTMLKDFTGKINKWDGNGYPQFRVKLHKGKCRNNENYK
jgi:hypothetical protein